MGYSGNMYAQATEVITSQGDLRRGDSSGNPERLAIGSSGKVLQSNGTTESWETLTTADSVLTTQGDILMEGAAGLERLGQSTDGFLLTTKGAAANPVWAAPAGGGGSLEFIATQTATDSTDNPVVTFSTAVDFTAYSEMYASFQFGTTQSSDINFQVGDTGEGGVITTSTYQQVKSDNSNGTFTSEVASGQDKWASASHPRIAAQNGVSGYVRVFLVRDSSDVTFLSYQAMIEGADSVFIASGINTTTQDDLKYFRMWFEGDRNIAGNNITFYKVKRS